MYFNCIVQDYCYHNMDKGPMWHCALVSCIPSQSTWLFFEWELIWCCVSLCGHFNIYLIEIHFIMIFTMIVVTFIGLSFFHLNYRFRLSVPKYFLFCKGLAIWMFPPLDILLEYWIQNAIFEALCAMFTFLTMILYRRIPDFATDFPYGVYSGSTTCLLYVGPPFGNLV